ncbi:MAG: hypothetical protein LBT19_00850 [Candidatus Nomurabacteria bacterium]|jgi:hypothetical protein|nr:hypothetical protein [Candidatus Nomurabacteria bacterium]
MIVLFWLIALVVATFWIWLPILIIVLIRRSKKKDAALMQQRQAQQQLNNRPPMQQFPVQNDMRREELNQKMYEELKKSQPDMEKVQGYVKEIEELSVPVQQMEGMPGYSYNGAPPSGNMGQRMVSQNYSPNPSMQYGQPMVKTDNHSGLNAILYIGSLLVVAGVGALVASVVEDSAKMMVMVLIIAIFYVGGMVIRRDKRLVTAGKALVGTALAVIPFLGFGFAGFVRMPGEIAWLITSVIGLMAYVVATIVLESRVIAYLSMAFLISLSLSMTATLALPMMYYFMFVMLIGVVAGLVKIFAGGKVPKLFSSVVDVTGKWLTFVTLIASLLFVGLADGQMYVWLFWLATIQSVIMWVDKKKLSEELLFRMLAHASILVTVLQIIPNDVVVFGVIFLILAVMHAVVSVVLGVVFKTKDRALVEMGIEIVMMVLAANSFVFMLVGGAERMAAVTCLASIIFIGLLCGVNAVVHKKVGWLYGVLAALIALPGILGGWALTGSMRWDSSTFFAVYIILMALSVVMRALVNKKQTGYDALGLTGVVVFGWIAVMCSLPVGASYQILGMALWTACFGIYGWLTQKKSLYEVAVYFGAVTVCRVASEMLGVMRVDGWAYVLTYAHIIALALIGLSVWRERGNSSKVRLGFAMGILTMMVGIRAIGSYGLTEELIYPLWFLILQVVFVVVGGLWKKKWMWMWGACGVVAAIMWFVKDMAFIWLIMLGFGLIGLVVWSLLRGKKS